MELFQRIILFSFYLFILTYQNDEILPKEKERACINIKKPESGLQCSIARIEDDFRCCLFVKKNPEEENTCIYIEDNLHQIKEYIKKNDGKEMDCSSQYLFFYSFIVMIPLVLF